GDRKLLQFWGKAPMTADHAFDQALMGEMVEAAILAVALSGSVDQRQIARLALRVGRLALAREIELLERECDLLGKADADKAAGRDRVAIANEEHGFRRGNDLALFSGAQIGQSRVLTHGAPPFKDRCLPPLSKCGAGCSRIMRRA